MYPDENVKNKIFCYVNLISSFSEDLNDHNTMLKRRMVDVSYHALN